jgi:3'(2'), 5'-bisphosphate nucleotidase
MKGGGQMTVMRNWAARAPEWPIGAAAFDTIHSDPELAGAVAEEAGRALVSLRDEVGHGDPDLLRDLGDRLSHTLITLRLAKQRPGDAILSEEGADDARRLRARRVWIVDPLDGTREFGEAGRSDWAVHVALVEGGMPVAAAVCLPARGLLMTTAAAPPPLAPRRGRCRLVVSRSHTPPEAVSLAEELDAELIPMGSAGVKTMAVVLGEADVYVHLGGQYEWDSAAPVGIALAAGLRASRVDGTRLRYNRPKPWLPDLVVCRHELHAEVLTALRRHVRPLQGKATMSHTSPPRGGNGAVNSVWDEFGLTGSAG